MISARIHAWSFLAVALLSSTVAAETTAPYGAWTSPISAAVVAGQDAAPVELATDGGAIYWVEIRPGEGGRSAIVAAEGDAIKDVIPADFNARNMVHEYGGGNLLVAGGTLFYPNFQDQRLYRQDAGKAPNAITPANGMRYADCGRSASLSLLVCVMEDHSAAHNVKNSLVAIPDKGAGAMPALFAESDFVAAPRLDSSGRKLAWISWNHPNMPWNKTTLWTAQIKRPGSLGDRKIIAKDASIVEPQWGPDGALYFVSDQSGWWNLYRYDGKAIKAVLPEEADFSTPAWVFGLSSYAIINDHTIVAAATRDALPQLVRIDVKSGASEPLTTPFVDIQFIRRLDEDHVVFFGATTTSAAQVIKLNIHTGEFSTVRPAQATGIDKAYISEAKALTYSTSDGDVAHAFYYAPKNPLFHAPDGALPPLIVSAHGGPTANNTAAYSPSIQYWTSRGFAYMEVNYRGSSGFGRDYRDKLNGAWGVADVADVVNGAKYAVAQGLADPKKLIVRGGSAGGYVVLASLAFYDVFATGASYYGIGDLAALAQDTHKFESRYMDSLVGPYPEEAALYKERSPMSHLEGFNEPLILFQGLDDKVVPPSQSNMIADALKKKGLPVEYLTYPGEGHGFVMRDNIISSLEAELAFYRRILKF